MAAIARAHGVGVIVATFEEWTPSRRDFDLVVAGTAWHWVDPTVGYDRAAAALRSGGSLAIFRSSYRYDDAIAAIIDRNLRHYAPHLRSDCVPLGTADPNRIDRHREDIEHRRSLFDGLEHRVFEHARVVTIEHWIDELTTHSPIMLLDDSVKDGLLADLAGHIRSDVGDTVHIVHDTHGLRARRR